MNTFNRMTVMLVLAMQSLWILFAPLPIEFLVIFNAIFSWYIFKQEEDVEEPY